MFACDNGHFDIVKYLVSVGADINAVDDVSKLMRIIREMC